MCPKKDKTGDFMPGFTFGGPILKNRLFGFIGFNPEFYTLERKVDYNQLNNQGGLGGPGGLGVVAFSQNTQTYYGTGRLDAAVSQKIRLYASWLYQLQKQSGENLPMRTQRTPIFLTSMRQLRQPPSLTAWAIRLPIPPPTWARILNYTAASSDQSFRLLL